MKKMTNFELSETPSFMAHYIAALFLPHTDLDLFPKLKGRLERRPGAKTNWNSGIGESNLISQTPKQE